jgi:hypothetical protein
MARDYDWENISKLYTALSRSRLLLPDREIVKFDLTNEIAIGGETFWNAH